LINLQAKSFNDINAGAQDAAKNGVKVVAVDAKVEDPSVKAFIGVNNAKAGADFGDFVVDGQNVQERALAASENLVTSSLDINVIYATGEPSRWSS
jgi:ribose transport system substrate-binding protein